MFTSLGTNANKGVLFISLDGSTLPSILLEKSFFFQIELVNVRSKSKFRAQTTVFATQNEILS